MTEIKLTPEQKDAIYSSGQNILVSASAGSGKTFVMVERILNKIKAGVSLKNLFISTFTVKAADELKNRLDKKIREERRNTKDNLERQYLTQALADLNIAHIGTTDSYTNFILKEYYYTIDIDPSFRLMSDKAEQDLIKEDVFSKLFESYLSGSDKIPAEYSLSKDRFTRLSKNFSNDRNIKGFKEVIFQVHSFAESTENPEAWLKDDFLKASQLYSHVSDLPITFTQDIKEDMYSLYRLISSSLESGLVSSKKAKEKSEAFVADFEQILTYLNNQELGKFATAIFNLDLDIRFGKTEDEAVKDAQNEFKLVKASLFGSKSKPGTILKFANNFKHTDVLEEYEPHVKEMTKDLQKVAIYFYKEYLTKKIEENSLEYADINHFALKILKENEEIRLHFIDKYNEVMIDEYQDANHIQEALYKLISNGHNLFMVGDIKQSIYSFRQADSQLFLDKYISYQDPNYDGKLIRLKENFRSRTEVLNFTNEFFKKIMDKNLGDMEYGPEEELVFGSREFPDQEDKTFYPELLLHKDMDASSTDLEDMSYSEIGLTGKKIKELVKQGVNYSDIVILVRSKSHNNEIEDILTAMNIPVVLDEGRNNYLKSLEVNIMLEAMRAIDNPLQDISFVALLNSPMFNFNEDDLSRIGLQGTSDFTFYRKYQAALDGTGDKPQLITPQLKVKLEEFEVTFNNWVNLSNKISLHKLIWQIYNDTYYYEYVGGMKNGSLRQANLQALSTRADDFEKNGYKGLYRFIKMIDSFLEQNNDLASVNIELPENAVRVMTIHKSKGLEFDYVFLLNMQVKFQQRDLSAKVILSRENGAGIEYIADMKEKVNTEFPQALVSMNTIPYLANREEKLLSSLSEEMRVLYVAFTRAVKKLYMVGFVKGKTPFAKYDNANFDANILDIKSRKGAKSYQDWLLALLFANHGGDLIDQASESSFTSSQLKMILNINEGTGEFDTILDTSDEQVFEEFKEEKKNFDSEMEITDIIKHARVILESTEELNNKYAKAIELPTIQTPSQIKKRYENIIEIDGISTVNEKSTGKFGFRENSGVSAVEIGSAVHEFMQVLNLNDISKESFEKTLEELAVNGKVKDKIDIDKMLSFFDTDLGKMIVDNADKVTREAPFSMLKTDEDSEEQYLIRGIVDGFITFTDKIILFDYKTDSFRTNKQIPSIVKRYEIQMELYSDALKMSYGVTDVEKYLILLGGPKEVVVCKMP